MSAWSACHGCGQTIGHDDECPRLPAAERWRRAYRADHGRGRRPRVASEVLAGWP